MVLEGEGERYTNDGNVASGQGDVIWTPRGLWHGFNNTGTTDVVLVWGWSGCGSLEDSGYQADDDVTAPWEDPRVVPGLAAQLYERRVRLADGASSVGWKVGFGAPSALDLMQIGAPLLGFLTDATVFRSGAEIPTSDWSRGLVEFEVAVFLGADVDAGASPAEAAAAVAGIAAAIEVADVDLPIGPDHVEEIMAGNIFHRGVIFGEVDYSRAGLNIDGLIAHIEIDGSEVAVVDDLQAITGRYPEIVSTVANTLASQGERLRAGEAIITGSVIPPVPVVEGRDFVFALRPLAPISIRCSGVPPLS